MKSRFLPLYISVLWIASISDQSVCAQTTRITHVELYFEVDNTVDPAVLSSEALLASVLLDTAAVLEEIHPVYGRLAIQLSDTVGLVLLNVRMSDTIGVWNLYEQEIYVNQPELNASSIDYQLIDATVLVGLGEFNSLTSYTIEVEAQMEDGSRLPKVTLEK